MIFCNSATKLVTGFIVMLQTTSISSAEAKCGEQKQSSVGLMVNLNFTNQNHQTITVTLIYSYGKPGEFTSKYPDF